MSKLFDKSLCFVIFFSLLISVSLLIAVWNINYMPTDAEAYFIPSAAKLHTFKHLSEMHLALDQTRVKWLHGKEILVVLLSWFQHLLNDPETLRPFMLLNISAVFLSSIFIFIISRYFWGKGIALWCYFLFTTCLWPYLYILLSRHQPIGLCLFLLAFCLLLLKPRRNSELFILFCSGALIGCAIFSSTVSFLYLPYFFFGFLWLEFKHLNKNITILKFFAHAFKRGFLMLLGFLTIFIYVNYPNIIENLVSYLDYININQHYNHFYYNQATLTQWIPGFNIGHTRGGWLWVIKYFFLIMPLLFSLYIISVLYLIWHILTIQNKPLSSRFLIFGLIILSWSSPILMEIKGTTQYGANYMTSIVGIILLIGFALFTFYQTNWSKLHQMVKTVLIGFLLLLTVFHCLYSLFVFITDAYPTRMVTTILSEYMDKNRIYTVAVNFDNFHRRSILDQMKPEFLRRINLTTVESIIQAENGSILIPPISQDSIYTSTSNYTDFDSDPILTRLINENRLKDYAIANFKTMASSFIWGQEEEILSYRYLILNQFPSNIDKSKVWLLDAQKLQVDKLTVLPTDEDIFLKTNNIRDIGTKALAHTFIGKEILANHPIRLKAILTKTYKVGSPSDSLVAYIYKADPLDQHGWIAWIPFNKDYASNPIPAQQLSANNNGDLTRFEFPYPLELEAGHYFITIYRSGLTDDQNFYRIYQELLTSGN